MIELRAPKLFSRKNDRKINRAPSPVLAKATPWATIMLASLCPALPLITSAPVMPPFGYMMLLAWSQVRPGLLPVWAGLPLGLFDDIHSGQPFGSGVLLWSLAIISSDIIEARIPWRSFATEWLIATAFIGLYLLLGLIFANAAGADTGFPVLLPQIILAALLYPVTGRIVARFDRLRLAPLKTTA